MVAEGGQNYPVKKRQKKRRGVAKRAEERTPRLVSVINRSLTNKKGSGRDRVFVKWTKITSFSYSLAIDVGWEQKKGNKKTEATMEGDGEEKTLSRMSRLASSIKESWAYGGISRVQKRQTDFLVLSRSSIEREAKPSVKPRLDRKKKGSRLRKATRKSRRLRKRRGGNKGTA